MWISGWALHLKHPAILSKLSASSFCALVFSVRSVLRRFPNKQHRPGWPGLALQQPGLVLSWAVELELGLELGLELELVLLPGRNSSEDQRGAVLAPQLVEPVPVPVAGELQSLI